MDLSLFYFIASSFRAHESKPTHKLISKAQRVVSNKIIARLKATGWWLFTLESRSKKQFEKCLLDKGVLYFIKLMKTFPTSQSIGLIWPSRVDTIYNISMGIIEKKDPLVCNNPIDKTRRTRQYNVRIISKIGSKVLIECYFIHQSSSPLNKISCPGSLLKSSNQVSFREYGNFFFATNECQNSWLKFLRFRCSRLMNKDNI